MSGRLNKICRYSLRIIFIILVSFIIFLATGFFAVRWGLTNVAGEEDENSFAYNLIAQKEPVAIVSGAGLPKHLSIYGENENLNWCRLGAAALVSPHDTIGMLKAYRLTKSKNLLDHMLLALELRKGYGSALSQALKTCRNEPGEWTEATLSQALAATTAATSTKSIYTWQNNEPWQIIKESILKDQAQISQVAKLVGIQPRLLVSVAIVEQLRLYYTQRELYERLFKPLKILANANKMAWGVMSIKEKMAIETENHLHDSGSAFYLGADLEKLLDFPPGLDVNQERYRRLTDEHSHYYSYLYGSLMVRQFIEQWRKEGYDLKYRPEIIATLFNIGFSHSQPKPDPAVGGSTLDINGEKYFFGSLAYEFYYSGELIEEFPFE